MSEVLLCCPLPGPPPDFSGDCNSCKTYVWTTNEVGELYYFFPYENKQIVSFEFSAITNSGSSIQVELYYCSGGECKVWETWNLGQLSTPQKKYALIDFEDTFVYNSLELRITTTGGSGGSISVCLDCDIPVILGRFCTGFTYNEISCDCTGSSVTLYAEFIKELPFEFPLNISGYTWFLDPELQIPAPCGDYMYDEKIVFTYDCNNESSSIKHICECSTEVCSASTKNNIYQHTVFTKPNPYIRGVANPPLNGIYFYSEQCINLTLTNQTPKSGFFKMTFDYTGTPDTVVVTITDPLAPVGTVGNLSFSLTQPPTSMMTIVDPLRTIPVASGGTTIWATWPQSRVFKVRVLAGYKVNNPSRAPVTTKITWYDCGDPLNAYIVGLHTYSAWDSIVNPKLTTVLYPMSGTPYTWTVGTPLFADRQMTQPAFPYFYGFSGDGSNQIVIKVADYYRREWGTKKYYVASQLKFQNKFQTVITPYKRHDREDENGEYRVENCIDPVMNVGKITSITPRASVLQPSRYYYLFGRVAGTNPSTAFLANNDYFYRTDFETVRTKKGKRIPLTGYEHALWKNSEALAIGAKQYTLSWNDDKRLAEVLRKRNKSWGRIVAWGASIITLAVGVLAAIIDPVGTISTLVGFGVGKVLENNNISGKFISQGAGQLVRQLFGNPAVKWGKNATGTGGAAKEAVAYPLQKLWHNIAHRNRGGIEKTGCLYDTCRDVRTPTKAWGLQVGFALALNGLDRLYSKGYTRTYKEQCSEWYGRFTTTPYVELGISLCKFDNLSGVEHATYCDGGYFYQTLAASPYTVEKKFTAYKTIIEKKLFKKRKDTQIVTILPDVPRFVTDPGKLTFLPYVSGRPYLIGSCYSIDCGPNFYGATYSNQAVSTTYFTPSYVLGELNNPLPIPVEVPEGYFYSNISQEDADNQAITWLSGFTAATYNQDSSGENKPGVTDEPLNFSHRLENMTYPASQYFCFLDEENTGISVGTKLYYDYDGVFSCLKGYYSTIDVGSGFYRKFYEVNSGGTVVDIWTQQNSNDTFATSSETSQTATTVSIFSGYTSAWFFTSDDYLETIFSKEYDNHNFNQIWGTQEFYDSPIVCAGFMDNDGDNLFYLYNNNLDTTQGYSLAPYRFYKPVNLTGIFNYIGDFLITIDMDEVCYPSGTTTGDTGVMFTLKDVSGNNVPSVYGLSFNAEISYNGTGNTTHQITFTSEDYEYFLSLDPMYQGNISGVTISEYLSPQAYNTFVYTAGTFTSCGDCTIAAEAEVPEGTLTINAGYGLQINDITVVSGDFPNFTYPITATTGTTMVGTYDVGTQFQVTLTGTRTGGTNKTISLYVNSNREDCDVISTDPSGTVYTLETSSYINISDNLSILIENSTSC